MPVVTIYSNLYIDSYFFLVLFFFCLRLITFVIVWACRWWNLSNLYVWKCLYLVLTDIFAEYRILGWRGLLICIAPNEIFAILFTWCYLIKVFYLWLIYEFLLSKILSNFVFIWLYIVFFVSGTLCSLSFWDMQDYSFHQIWRIFDSLHVFFQTHFLSSPSEIPIIFLLDS